MPELDHPHDLSELKPDTTFETLAARVADLENPSGAFKDEVYQAALALLLSRAEAEWQERYKVLKLAFERRLVQNIVPSQQGESIQAKFTQGITPRFKTATENNTTIELDSVELDETESIASDDFSIEDSEKLFEIGLLTGAESKQQIQRLVQQKQRVDGLLGDHPAGQTPSNEAVLKEIMRQNQAKLDALEEGRLPEPTEVPGDES